MSTKTTDHDFYMGLALQQAEMAFHEKEIPVGAVVVCGGRVIARAHNLTYRLNDPTAHAEMLAITSAANHLGSRYLNECTLYVTLEPCAMCAGAASWAMLGGIVYGASDAKRGYRHFSEAIAHPKTQVVSGIRAAECEWWVKRFFEEIRGN